MGAMRLTSHWCSVHDLILGYCVVFMVHIGACARCFSLDNVYLHVLDFDSHQQEVYLPYNDVFQVVSGEEKIKIVSGEGTGHCMLAKDGVGAHLPILPSIFPL